MSAPNQPILGAKGSAADQSSVPPTDPVLALGALRPSEGTTQSDLDAALQDLRSSVSGGQPLSSILSGVQRDVLFARTAVGVSLTAEAMRQVAPAVARFGAVSSPMEPLSGRATSRRLVMIRTLPIPEADPLAPAWSRGLKANARRGPFVNDAGERFWIDTFLLPEFVDVVAKTGIAGATRLLARLPLKRRIAPTARRRLAAGSVWLPSNVLVKGRPPNEFVGMRITGGSLELTGVESISGTTITLAGAWRMKLVLDLDAPSNPAPATGPGVDASNAVVTLPATATIALDATGASSIDISDASATAFGAVSFVPAPSAPFYDELSRSIVVPYTASLPQFDFATVQSASVSIHCAERADCPQWVGAARRRNGVRRTRRGVGRGISVA